VYREPTRAGSVRRIENGNKKRCLLEAKELHQTKGGISRCCPRDQGRTRHSSTLPRHPNDFRSRSADSALNSKNFAQNASGLFRLNLPISGMTGMTRCLETSQALTTTCRAPANSKLRKRPARIGFSSFLSFLLLLLLVGLLGEMSAEGVGASGPPSASEHQ